MNTENKENNLNENNTNSKQTDKSDCTHDCSSCGKAGNCSKKAPQKLDPNSNSNIKKVIGVVSGKGGVGKSLVCSLLATKLSKQGLKVGILDADITGPSIPKIFGIESQLTSDGQNIFPAETKGGIKLVSTNLLLEDQDMPVAWRGPVVTGVLTQFFNQVNWGDLDVLLVDMPPGTSDVFLTVMQTLPVDGIVTVSTPQDLVGMIVGKAVRLADMMDTDVIGLVENMSYFKCPDCGKEYSIFGESQANKVAEKYGISTLDKLPINPEFAKMCDAGKIEDTKTDSLLENVTKRVAEL